MALFCRRHDRGLSILGWRTHRHIAPICQRKAAA